MQYDTIYGLINDLQLDMNHWINKEFENFSTKKKFDAIKVNLQHIPDELLALTTQCENKHTFVPNWLEKRYPISIFYCQSRGLLRQATCFIKCPVCDAIIHFKIPLVNHRGEINIYGDEAMRVVDNKTIFTYSFVSFSGSDSNRIIFEKEFLEAKRKLSPLNSPKDWTLHLKDIFNTETRNRDQFLQHLSYADAIEGIHNILEIIKNYNDRGDLNIYSAVGIVHGTKLSKEEKTEVQSVTYNAALMRVIQESTSHGLSPKFYFERTGDDGWAKNLFDGGRLTLLWGHITHGLPVMTPQFVPPTDSLYLEIADIVSYIIARYLFLIGKRVKGDISPIVFDPSSLGKVRYILIDGYGNWKYETSSKFPSKTMFKNTSWKVHI